MVFLVQDKDFITDAKTDLKKLPQLRHQRLRNRRFYCLLLIMPKYQIEYDCIS